MNDASIIAALREVATELERAKGLHAADLEDIGAAQALRLRDIAKAMEARKPVQLASDVILGSWPEHPIDTNGFRVEVLAGALIPGRPSDGQPYTRDPEGWGDGKVPVRPAKMFTAAFCRWWHEETGEHYGPGLHGEAPPEMCDASEAFEAGRRSVLVTEAGGTPVGDVVDRRASGEQVRSKGPQPVDGVLYNGRTVTRDVIAALYTLQTWNPTGLPHPLTLAGEPAIIFRKADGYEIRVVGPQRVLG
jgi:hypothetical protein